MTSEQLIGQLRQAIGERLKSVVLYGSAAAGDFLEGISGVDVLIVAEQLGAADLAALSGPLRRWHEGGNPQPQLFTPEELAGSADAFPIELLDIQQSHKVLFGHDLLVEMKIDKESFRVQLERELKSRLSLLRRKYLAACGNAQRVTQLLVESVSTFLVLFRAALRLYDESVPAQKADALRSLAGYIEFDPQPFLTVLEFKERKGKSPPANAETLLADYLNSVEKIIRAVDRRLHASSPQEKAYE